jgi:hypothetical protein
MHTHNCPHLHAQAGEEEGEEEEALELDLLAKSCKGGLRVRDPAAAEEDEGACACACACVCVRACVCVSVCLCLYRSRGRRAHHIKSDPAST